MKCVKIESAKNLVLDNIDVPVSKNGSVVIKVESCGICGSDIHYWVSGEPKGLVMGHEFAGTVVDPGSRTDLKVGDRVTGLPISPCGKCDACKTGNPQYCRSTWAEAVGLSLTNPGGYAEFTSCRPDLVRKLPDNMTFDQAAMVEPSAVSLHAVSLANIKVGSKVLVIGAGIIGMMALEFAKLEGASFIAVVEANELRGEKAVNIGKADKFYNALKENIVQELIKDSNGGFDVVIECCGNSAAITEAITTVKPGGTVVLVGVSLGAITVPLTAAVLYENVLKGAIAYTEKDFDTTISLISNKVIDVDKYISDKVPLSKANESFERLTNGKDAAVKIILKPQE